MGLQAAARSSSAVSNTRTVRQSLTVAYVPKRVKPTTIESGSPPSQIAANSARPCLERREEVGESVRIDPERAR